MTICHIISPWPTRVDTGHPWGRAHKSTGQERWLAYQLDEPILLLSYNFGKQWTSPDKHLYSLVIIMLEFKLLVAELEEDNILLLPSQLVLFGENQWNWEGQNEYYAISATKRCLKHTIYQEYLCFCQNTAKINMVIVYDEKWIDIY